MAVVGILGLCCRTGRELRHFLPFSVNHQRVSHSAAGKVKEHGHHSQLPQSVHFQRLSTQILCYDAMAWVCVGIRQGATDRQLSANTLRFLAKKACKPGSFPAQVNFACLIPADPR